MNTKSTGKKENPGQNKNSNWLRNFAIGLLLFISGILARFYPATIITVTYIVAGAILAIIGICDGIAALKYKETGSERKLVLIMGALSLIAAIYFIPAVIYLYSVNITIYIVAAWLISRGALDIAGKVKGTFKRKNVLLWAVVMIAVGILGAVFCEPIVAYCTSYLSYILIAAGVLLAFFGIYQKTDDKEAKEKALREDAIRKGLDEAVHMPKQSPGILSEPKKEDISQAAVTEPAGSKEGTTSEPETTEEDNSDVIEVQAEIIEEENKTQTKKKGLFGSLFKK